VTKPRALWTRDFVRIVGVMGAFGFSFSIFFLLPKYLALELGGSPSEIGLVMGAFGVASVLMIPVLGRITDRLGRRGALVAANAAMALAAAGFALVHGMGAEAVLLRGVQGVAWALGFSSAMALVSELAPPDRLAQAIGLSGAASLLMNAVAPAIGEPIAARLGHRPVFLLGALAAAAGVALARGLPRVVRAAPSAGGATGSDGAAAARGRGALFAVFGMGGLAFGALFTFLAPFALERGIHAIRPFFVAYTVAALAVRLFTSRLADRFGYRLVAVTALALYGAVVAATGLLGPGSLVATGACFGAAHGALFPAIMALLLRGTASARRPRLLGLANGAMSLGNVAVIPVGMLAERLHYPAVFVATGLVTAATAALLLRKR
jgi:MFS family permease